MTALWIFALPICIADWRVRKIPNIYLIFLAYVIFIQLLFYGVRSLAVQGVVCVIALFSVIFLKIGMGDAKLLVLTVLALDLGQIYELLALVTCIYIASILQIMIIGAMNRRIPSSIPLAGAIFMGTALYLGTNVSTTLQEYVHAVVNSW